MVSALIQPPTGLDAPDTVATIVLIALAATVAGLCIWGLLRREWLLIILLLGGAVASLVEAQLDLLSRIWWADNLTRSYTMFDRPIPLFATLGYTVLVGGGTYSAYKLISKGATRRQLVTLTVIFFFVESLFEIVWLNVGFYDYYGPQPLTLFGFPLYWGAINSVGAVTGGFVVYKLRDHLRGPGMLLAVLIPPLSFGTDFAVGWPTWTSMNSGAPLGVITVIALITTGLCALEVWTVSGAAEREGEALRVAPEPAAPTGRATRAAETPLASMPG